MIVTVASLRSRQRAMIALELLVALAVVAIAIIGIAALYSEEVDPTGAVAPRIQAGELAETIAKRIEANPTGRSGYASVVGVICNTPPRTRRADDAASTEAACWHDEVETKLPNGLGSITRDATTTPPTYVIAVSWSSAETGTASYVMRVQPRN